MKKLISLFLVVVLSACSNGGGSSGGGGGSGGGGSNPTNGWPTYSVGTASALPTCAGDVVGRLYYVEDSLVFKVCKSTGWQTITLGNSTVSNLLIASSSSDYCTQYVGEGCYFNGGQLVKYSDGSVLMLGGWTFLYSTSTPDYDTDHSYSSVSVLFPASVTVGYQKLSPLVARGTGYKSAYLVYTRSPESVKVIYDTDGDGLPEPTDEVLFAASVVGW